MLNFDLSMANESASDEKSTFLSMNADEIALDDDDDDGEDGGGEVCQDRSEPRKRLSGLQLPAPKNNGDDLIDKDNVPEGAAFVIDSTPGPTASLDISEESERRTEVDVPKKKVMKRRNQSMYAQNPDE